MSRSTAYPRSLGLSYDRQIAYWTGTTDATIVPADATSQPNEYYGQTCQQWKAEGWFVSRLADGSTWAFRA